MTKYLPAARTHLKLVHKLLRTRLAQVEQKPKGNLLRNNQIKHTQAMLGLLGVLRGMLAHDELTWWEDNEDIPF